ncbi:MULTISPECIES: XisI protein [Calothrix]|uniref:XisI protein n=2 Tax=Calothrix TaxID=1186 RepID=A0ABR8A5R0_9CYAN|nr:MULTISPECIES: XisI protein [Calothrix]MBD2195189.1 XisI protein [Calothrix parietina FACHB-288]MBD2223840.1 XisI protein [Calothrix anomala FACHB-343]
MDSLKAQYRNIIEKVLQDYADFLGSDEDVEIELVFDRERDRYLLVEAGWQNGYRIYGNLQHINMVDCKLWIQHDGTEDGVAVDLVAAGIPKEQIVLGFRTLEQRKLTEFAVS